MQAQRGEDGIKAVFVVWKMFFVLDDITGYADLGIVGEGGVAVEEGGGGLGSDEVGYAV